MRKFICITLVLLLVLLQLPIEGVAQEDANGDSRTSNTKIIITDVETKDSNGKDIKKIYPNEDFKLIITLGVSGSTDNINDIFVQLGSSKSFSPQGQGSKKSIDENYYVTFNIYYNGGDDTTIPITIYYNEDGEEKSISDYISITNIVPSSSEEKPDKSKVIPNLTIISSKTITAEVGRTTYIPITIKNSSDVLAENISVTAQLEGESPITIDNSGYESISRLRGGRTEDLDFRISIDEYAENKTYPIKINFQFYNEYGVSFNSSDTIYIKVENQNKKPLISINKVDIEPVESEAEKPTTVGFELVNNGTLEAKDIKVSLGGISNDTFTLSSGFNSKYIEKIPGGRTAYVEFEIIPSIKLSGGSHGLDLNLNYKDGTNQPYEDTNKFFVNVASNKGKGSNLIIENLTYPDGAVGQNKDVTIGFRLKNIGKIDAKNVKVTVESSDQNGIVPKTVSIKKVNSMAPNKSENLSFVFLTTKDAETKNYPINITIEYEDDLTVEEKHILTQYVGVYVVRPGEEGKTTPKLIIDKYNFEPSIVRAGENYTMNLSFYNTNKQKAVRNIKIFLTADEKTDPDGNSSGGNVFTPVDSSNTFYIDSIPPKGRVEKSITMFTVPDAQAKTYTVTANFEYEDSQGEEYTATELIGVPVIQKSKLEIGELNLPPEAFAGEPIPIFVEFYNTGKVTLYNMMVKLEGDFQTENGSYYVGSFEMGRSEYFEGMIIPMEPGELSGSLVFTYEDSSGENVEIRENFTLNVMESAPMDEFPEDMPPEGESRGIKKILKSKGFWISIISIGAGFGGFMFYKKKKKKGMALDE
ncbi:COG1361 S-layer family protein [Schnuerera ultunensis]|uniref:COG1361 S-layer family protein n=1 Tax=Schnuerera ultunensis TaxID=45497 RepID=UPI0004074BD6|nr:CARDB domain-containing protein [Schnuerera ultunensis]